MDSRKSLIGVCTFLAIALLLLLVFTLCTGSQKGSPAEASPRGKGVGFGRLHSELLDKGLMGSVMDSLARGSSLPAGSGRSDGDAADGTPGDGEPPAAGEGTEGGDGAASEEEKKHLQLIEIKGREAGKKTLYHGSESAGSRTGNVPTRGQASPYAGPSEEQVLNTFASFIQKLKRSARASAREHGGREGGGAGAKDKELSDDSLSPVLSVGPFEGPKTPTLQLLERVNQDSAHSVRMSRDPGMEDGTRDHFGKNFDGNQKTYDVIPIDEAHGAFGSKEIRAAKESVDTNARPADLKR